MVSFLSFLNFLALVTYLLGWSQLPCSEEPSGEAHGVRSWGKPQAKPVKKWGRQPNSLWGTKSCQQGLEGTWQQIVRSGAMRWLHSQLTAWWHLCSRPWSWRARLGHWDSWSQEICDNKCLLFKATKFWGNLLHSCCCCCWVASVVSDSVRPQRWQPTRLPRPWDSPGKNPGVGCRFLLQRMKMKSESEVPQSCLTLRDPMDCSLPGSSIHGISHTAVDS